MPIYKQTFINYYFFLLKNQQEKTKELQGYNYKTYQDDDLKRQFKKLTELGYAALPEDKYKELNKATSNMQSNYAKIKICSFHDKKKCDLSLEPGRIFKISKN